MYSQLIENAVEQLRSLNLKPSTITAYEHRSFYPVKVFFDEQEETLYSTELSANFLTVTKRLFELQQISAKTKRFREKGIFILDELYLTGCLYSGTRSQDSFLKFLRCEILHELYA